MMVLLYYVTNVLISIQIQLRGDGGLCDRSIGGDSMPCYVTNVLSSFQVQYVHT